MTPAHTDSPLRRSEAGVFRDGVQNVIINDDEEERRQARRRTMLTDSSGSSTLEESETLKKCLEIYNGNKLSKDNAWSLSLIDTLSTLLDKHHKSLNNFKVAGSSLEASSKVYGLRVDSIHTDVLRMSAGLNAQKFANRAVEEDGDDNGNEPAADGDGAEKAPGDAVAAKPAKPKRTRRQVSTVTKNKESLNARLDTVPLTDPVFGKLNSIVGSINSSNRLLNNILPSKDSELRLRLDFQFWDKSTVEAIDYTEPFDCSEEPMKLCEKLLEIKFEELKLRPMHSAYVISDTPEDIDDEAEKDDAIDSPTFEDDREMSMAFDINADVEPIPLTGQTAPIVDVDFGDYEDLTSDERVAINQCKGLRKPAVLIEDLRPVDASSKLEYSYRPLDKISQFWAGPSHWKFKKNRPRSSVTGAQHQNSKQQILSQPSAKPQSSRGRPKQRPSKYVNFGEFHDDLFVKLDDKFKSRKTNVQKKWDARKLKLPTDLQIDPNMFFKFQFAPGIPVEEDAIESSCADLQTEPAFDDESNHMDGDDHHGDDGAIDDDGFNRLTGEGDDAGNMHATFSGTQETRDGDQTILEIATDFDGAPQKVTKIIVPFAKRAKVIDMKSLKKCCTQLLKEQLQKPVVGEIPQLAIPRDEQYAPGVASFQQIYSHLPEVLTPSMTEALSPSVAFYSMLHLANDLNLRLIPQTDLKDFSIRQIL